MDAKFKVDAVGLDENEIDDPEIEDKLKNLIKTLYKRATETATTVDIKSYRIVNIPEEDEVLLASQLEQSPELMRRFTEDGVLFKQEVTVKQHLPDAHLAKMAG